MKVAIARTVWICLFLATVLLVAGCSHMYRKCGDCGTVYKSVGGFPGQTPKICRSYGCNGRLYFMSEKESGWDEERYQRLGDEIP